MSISFFAECTVLITGASAGIGREFARQLAPAVNTMVLVARRNERLAALEMELRIINPHLEVFSRQLDLRDHAALERFCNWLDESGLSVDLLINNAGLGDRGAFIDSEWERVLAMLQVNIETLTYLTYRILPSMRKSGCGAILNVSSVASLVPVPHLAVYAATKAYVTSFSEALRAELRSANISVTTLCPGPVPTEFDDVARREPQVNTAAAGREMFSVPVQEVVRRALNAVSRDKARIIPGTLVNLSMTIFAFIPMYLKRLILNAQAMREKASFVSPAHPKYEISGMI
ncbi:MAG: SDR family oxidoreductase [Verrucomicrobia bacterium]|nr:SDR family oxidoreductase [Verrucomicrobiota bacterium]MBV9642382.1 SDR family oxidoreductase [Verrucomicrobiota bacterium]